MEIGLGSRLGWARYSGSAVANPHRAGMDCRGRSRPRREHRPYSGQTLRFVSGTLTTYDELSVAWAVVTRATGGPRLRRPAPRIHRRKGHVLCRLFESCLGWLLCFDTLPEAVRSFDTEFVRSQ
jgi:hypothetical protein